MSASGAVAAGAEACSRSDCHPRGGAGGIGRAEGGLDHVSGKCLQLKVHSHADL